MFFKQQFMEKSSSCITMPQSHDMCWHIAAFLSFIECPHCYEAKPTRLTDVWSVRPRHWSKIFQIISKRAQYLIKIAWHLVIFGYLGQQSIQVLYTLATTSTTFLGYMALMRWRLKQLAALFILRITTKKSMIGSGEICRQKEQLELGVLTLCGRDEASRISKQTAKFCIAFNVAAALSLLIIFSEIEANFMVRYAKYGPSQIWPFESVKVDFWIGETFLLLTADALTIAPYCLVAWWCGLVYTGSWSIRILREASTGGRKVVDVESLQRTVLCMQAYYETLETGFSDILFWHISAAVLTALSWVDAVLTTEDAADNSGNLFLASVAPQMLLWNTVFLVGVPLWFAIQFQQEVSAR